jgi:hypothetical protein
MLIALVLPGPSILLAEKRISELIFMLIFVYYRQTQLH